MEEKDDLALALGAAIRESARLDKEMSEAQKRLSQLQTDALMALGRQDGLGKLFLAKHPEHATLQDAYNKNADDIKTIAESQ